MADKIGVNEIVEQAAIDQVKSAQAEIKALQDAYIKMAASIRGQDINIFKADGIKNSEAAIRQQKQDLTELDRIKKQLLSTEQKLAAAQSLEAQLLAEQKAALKDVNSETAHYVKIMNSQEGSVDQMRSKLELLRKQYSALGESMRLGGNGQKMLADIQKLDGAVKLATFNTGKYTDNVGNYQSATFQLTQVLRELPAFTYSAQTGIMGISNNLPILTDAFQKVRKETGSAWQALKIFGSSLFSFGNIFAVAVGLLTIFSDKLFASDKAASGASKSIADLKTAQDSLNMALASAEYKKAVTDVNELRINIDLAKKGFIDKTDVVNQYNKTLGDSLGKVTSLDAAEKMLVKNGEAYIQMTLLKAAANISLERAATEYLNAELKSQEAADKLAAGRDVEGNYKPGALESFKLLFSQGLGSDADNFQKQTKKEVDGIKKEGDKFKDISSKFQEDAAKLAQAMGMDLFGKQYDTKAKKETTAKGKPTITPNLSDTDIADLRAYYENLRKAQIEALGNLVNDPESKKAFEDFLLGGALSGDQSISDEAAKQLADDLIKRVEDNAKKLQLKIDKQKALDDAVEIARQINEITQQYGSAANDIAEAMAMRANLEADTQIKNIDKVLKADLDALDRRSMSQKQKDEERARLELQAEARRKAIDRERIKALRTTAAIQKAADVANIITSTALAIVGFLAKPGGYPGIALSIGAGVTGAAQLAKAIATPLPQYFKGTESKPQDGPAWVGEKGIEKITLPDGTSFLSPGTATIMDLPKQTVIKPHEETMKELMYDINAAAFRKMANTSFSRNDAYNSAILESIQELSTDTKTLIKIMANKKEQFNFFGDNISHIDKAIS